MITMNNEDPADPSVHEPRVLDAGVGRLEPERAGFLVQIEACRSEVAQWPDWMRQERAVPAWMANHATDL